MTAALTAIGVQYGSITIAASSTSNTATITTVGSGAFIILMGQNSSVNGLDTDSLGAVALTNTTTVTATRNSSSSGTITLNFCVVDGDTTNLIKSVQSGTVTVLIANSSGTATISAVTNANAAVEYLGVNPGSSITNLGQFNLAIALSGTTVTASREFSSGSTADVINFQVIEFQGAALNSSTQNLSISVSSGTSNTTTITSVTAANSWLVNGNSKSNTNANNFAFMPYNTLTNGSTVTTVTNTDPGGGNFTTNLVVVELVSGLLAASTQRGTISLSAASSGTATISSVVKAQAMTNFLMNTTDQAVTDYKLDWSMLAFTNATTITFQNAASVTSTGSYEVVVFNPISVSIGNSIWFGAIA